MFPTGLESLLSTSGQTCSQHSETAGATEPAAESVQTMAVCMPPLPQKLLFKTPAHCLNMTRRLQSRRAKTAETAGHPAARAGLARVTEAAQLRNKVPYRISRHLLHPGKLRPAIVVSRALTNQFLGIRTLEFVLGSIMAASQIWYAIAFLTGSHLLR